MGPFSNTLMMDVRRLRVLRELHQRGTVAATAEVLHLTPSAISQQISALAREAGVPLLAPRGRGVQLTPQALLLLDHAAAIEAQMERARADLAAYHKGLSGRVALGAFATAFEGLVAPVLARLARERPGLRVAVLETEAPDCFSRLDAGSLDLVVTVDHRTGPSHGDGRYRRVDLLDDPLLAAVPEGDPLAGTAALALADLAERAWILGAMRGPCQEVGLAACAASGFSPDIRHQVNDWSAVFALVAAGGGVALVPRMAVPAGGVRGVALRSLEGPQRPCRHVYAALRAGSEAHPSLTPVLDLLVEAGRSVAALS